MTTGRQTRQQGDKMKTGDLHDDSTLMIPPPGFKFIPRFETVCGKPGCFECFDIFCERCESKDRRIVELEMRNNDLVKYITQLQGKIFGRDQTNPRYNPSGRGIDSTTIPQIQRQSPGEHPLNPSSTSDPFAYIQSPVLYDPNMNVSYVATTTFAPAPHDVPYSGVKQ